MTNRPTYRVRVEVHPAGRSGQPDRTGDPDVTDVKLARLPLVGDRITFGALLHQMVVTEVVLLDLTHQADVDAFAVGILD